MNIQYVITLTGRSNPYTALDKPLVDQKFETPTISRQTVREVGKVISHTHRSSLTPRAIHGTHFC